MITEIKKDLWRYEGVNCHRLLTQLRYLFFTPGFRYTYYMRHARIGRFLKPVWVVLLKLCSWKYHIQIPYQTSIGEGFYIGHFGTIVVNPAAEIGKNCSIAAGVLIGSSFRKEKHGTPVIGDNVSIGFNAILIGPIRIGNDVHVAPGAFVNFDVPDNCIVIGNPGKIIQRESSPTKRYVVYPVQNYQ